MIWTVKPKDEFIAGLAENTMIKHLGIEFLEFTDDSITARMPVDHRTVQPYGILHGGASAALAETLGSLASQFVIPNPATDKVAGIELNISHLRMASEGYVTGTVRPVKVGRRIHVWNIDITDDNGKQVSKARLTVARI